MKNRVFCKKSALQNARLQRVFLFQDRKAAAYSGCHKYVPIEQIATNEQAIALL